MDVNAGRVPYTACPLCNSENFQFHSDGYCGNHEQYTPLVSPMMQWMECKSCGHVFTSGYLTNASMAEVYKNALPHQHPLRDVHGQRIVSAKMVSRLTQFLPSWPNVNLKDFTWFDVGFGNGALLTAADEFGYKTYGTEYPDALLEFFKGQGFDVERREFLDIQKPASFNVISMADYLEHVDFPIKYLEHAHHLLAKDGLLFLSMPNTEHFVWRITTEAKQNPFWGEIAHMHNFARSRLQDALRKAGFQPLDYHVSDRYVMCMELIARKI